MVVVSIMPSLAKKYECQREEISTDGNRDVDYSISTRNSLPSSSRPTSISTIFRMKILMILGGINRRRCYLWCNWPVLLRQQSERLMRSIQVKSSRGSTLRNCEYWKGCGRHHRFRRAATEDRNSRRTWKCKEASQRCQIGEIAVPCN